MADRFRNFDELSAHTQRDIDYSVRHEDRGSTVVIMAPHGGWIEPGTSEIAEEIAGSDLSFYAFEALKRGPHGDFHITSHRFDEPKAIDLVGRCQKAIAIHGRRDTGKDAVWLGGLATGLRDAIGASLRSAGFKAEPTAELPGRDPNDICNRTLFGKGVQLEIPKSLRDDLKRDPKLMEDFCQAIRASILSTLVV